MTCEACQSLRSSCVEARECLRWTFYIRMLCPLSTPSSLDCYQCSALGTALSWFCPALILCGAFLHNGRLSFPNAKGTAQLFQRSQGVALQSTNPRSAPPRRCITQDLSLKERCPSKGKHSFFEEESYVHMSYWKVEKSVMGQKRTMSLVADSFSCCYD